MNYRTTLILLATLVVIGFAAWWVYDRSAGTGLTGPESPGKTEQDGAALLKNGDLPTDGISSITVNTGDKAVELVREGADWWQTRPVRWPLNGQMIDDLVLAAAGLRYAQSFTPGASKETPTLADAGLHNPLATIIFRFTAGKPEHAFYVGKRSLGGRGYLRLDKDPKVYLVGDTLYHLAVEQSVNDWRRHNLTVPSASSVVQATLTREGSTIKIEKTAGQWQFAAPLSGRASSTNVTGLIGAVERLTIDKFVADAPQDMTLYGLDKPTAVLALSVASAPPASAAPPAATPAIPPVGTAHPTRILRIGAPVDFAQEAYFATWSDAAEAPEPAASAGGVPNSRAAPLVVFQIKKDAAARFALSVDDLRDPSITVVKAADVKEFAVARRDVSFRLVHGAYNWEFGDPKPAFAADDRETARVVEQLLDAQAKSYRPDAHPVDDPIVTLTLTAVTRALPDVLRIYPPDKPGGPNLVIRQGETVGHLVPAEQLQFLFGAAPMLALRERLVMDVPLRSLVRVVINHADGQRFEFTRQPIPTTVPAPQPAASGEWKLTGADKHDAAALNLLLASVSPLTTRKWLTPAEGGGASSGGMWDTTLELGFADGTTRKLAVGSGRRLVGRVGEDFFELDKSVVDAINAEFRQRIVLIFSGRDIKRVVSHSGAETVTVDHDTTGRYVSPDGQTLNQTACGQLFDTLGGLRVKRFSPAASIKNLSTPQVTLTIETATGTSHKLELWDPLHNEARLPIGRLDGGETLLVFDAETATRLIAAPLLTVEPSSGNGFQK